MGVVYKLKSEIRDFIIAQKQTSPEISCRKMAELVEERFAVRISKSHINAIFKKAGLSQPVGRHPKGKTVAVKQRVGKPTFSPAVSSGKSEESKKALIARPSDYVHTLFSLLGLIFHKEAYWGSSEAFKRRKEWERYVYQQRPSFLVRYLSSGLGEHFSDSTSFALPLIQNSSVSNLEKNLLFVHSLKIQGENDSFLFSFKGKGICLLRNPNRYVDVTYWSADSYIRDIINGSPLLISYLSGYKALPLEFWRFFKLWTGDKTLSLPNFQTLSYNLRKIELLGWQNNVLNTYILPNTFNNRRIIFIIWPWQFKEYISLGKIYSSSPFYFPPQNKELFLEDRAVEIFLPQKEGKTVLRAIVVKNRDSSSVEAVICTNILSQEEMSKEKAALFFLNCWPSFKEGVNNFSFHSDASRRFVYFCPEEKKVEEALPKDNQLYLVDKYIVKVMCYFRNKIMPPIFRNKDGLFCWENFLSLQGNIRENSGVYEVRFDFPSGYSYSKEFSFICRRLNEEHVLYNGKKLWFVP